MENIKLTDTLFIYRDKNGIDRLIYIIDPAKKKIMQILNMREVENNVNEAVQKYIRFLNINSEKNLSRIKLFAFLLKIKLYQEYILRILLGHMLFDEYDQLTKDNTFAFIIAEYLLNKEPLSEENKSIIKDIRLFNKLYSSVKDVTFKMPEFYINDIYLNFILTLKAENISTQES